MFGLTIAKTSTIQAQQVNKDRITQVKNKIIRRLLRDNYSMAKQLQKYSPAYRGVVQGSKTPQGAGAEYS